MHRSAYSSYEAQARSVLEKKRYELARMALSVSQTRTTGSPDYRGICRETLVDVAVPGVFGRALKRLSAFFVATQPSDCEFASRTPPATEMQLAEPKKRPRSRQLIGSLSHIEGVKDTGPNRLLRLIVNYARGAHTALCQSVRNHRSTNRIEPGGPTRPSLSIARTSATWSPTGKVGIRIH
jgi:hypothetical protein